MSSPTVLDKTYYFITKRMVETGQAPHYTEIAKELGVSVEEGRQVLRELFSRRVPGWLAPGTDFIASFAPFNNQPTQFRITIDGQQKWFGQ
ncbi:MAG TPA: hypothetical protein PLW90_03965 [Smithellaceae bacterium]|jgi:hypothetical protein|nr:hypothetical protein [Smithellaceae bacterium]HNT91930.1 hypothetical protein [Smithellaceae bacterium]HNV64880.1 hypothetical protein [Smithellaceae bacterium]HOD31633.1 hypothetical protein [Smithellaceae bacterium]HOF76743.1 hypothetical protein [Smithellaceae bacterium]